MAKSIRFLEGTALGAAYANRMVSIRAGVTKEIPDKIADAMLESFPGCFELVSDGNQERSSDVEESSSEDSSDEDTDGISSDVKSQVLSVLDGADPMKITSIADEMSVTWQSIRSDIQSLVDEGSVSKSDDNLYSVS